MSLEPSERSLERVVLARRRERRIGAIVKVDLREPSELIAGPGSVGGRRLIGNDVRAAPPPENIREQEGGPPDRS